MCSKLKSKLLDDCRVGILSEMYKNLEGIIPLIERNLEECVSTQTLHEFLGALNDRIHTLEKTESKSNLDVKLQIDLKLRSDGLKIKSFDKKKKKINVDVVLSFQLSSLPSWDLFSSYNCNLTFYFEGHSQPFFAWHLDRENNTDGKFSHPLYHFQVGGKMMENFDYKDIYLMSSPRLPHPPMDPVLLLHFLIQNFVNSTTYSNKITLLEDYAYQDAIRKAQKMILVPYFTQISSNHQSQSSEGDAYKLFPLIGLGSGGE